MNDELNLKNNTSNDSLLKAKYTEFKSGELLAKLDDFKDNFGKDIKELNETIEKIEEKSMLLSLVPQEVVKEINKLSPKLAESVLNTIMDNVGSTFTKKFNENMESCNEKLEQLQENILAAVTEIESLKSQKLRRGLFSAFSSLAISCLATVGATFYTLKHYPQSIRIDHSGNINVESSRIFVDGTSQIKASSNTKLIKSKISTNK